MKRLRIGLLALGLCVIATACSSATNHSTGSATTSTVSSASSTPLSSASDSQRSERTSSNASAVPAHVVVVMMENRSYSDIVGSKTAPFLNSLARGGLSLTHFYAVTHPSQPNYIALFSGKTQGTVDDSCRHTFSASNLARELLDSGHTFAGYSEGLPVTGSKACVSGRYARKHAPWANFSDVPSSVQRKFSAFPSDYRRLPTLSFVIPNLDHDMHDGTIRAADQWLSGRLGAYARWAKTHSSLLVVSWDEDDHSQQNQIPTFVYGAGVRAASYAPRANLYSLLRTFESLYRLHPLGASASARPIPLH